jgi:siderophore synthetase component
MNANDIEALQAGAAALTGKAREYGELSHHFSVGPLSRQQYQVKETEALAQAARLTALADDAERNAARAARVVAARAASAAFKAAKADADNAVAYKAAADAYKASRKETN